MQEQETLALALRLAGDIQLNYFNSTLEISHKESQSSIVTNVDLACEKEIINAIRQSFPDHNILSEECGFFDNKSDYSWIIDPLDGTSNFAAGIPWFGVLISLFNKDIPVIAGAYLPVQNTMYIAERDKGSSMNGKVLRVEDINMIDSLCAFSMDYTTNINYLRKGLEIYEFIIKNSRNVRSTNSLIDLLFVAESKFGGCVNFHNRIWDIAAPALIISEAGGIVKDIDGNDLTFKIGKPYHGKNYPIIAGSSDFIEKIRQLRNEIASM